MARRLKAVVFTNSIYNGASFFVSKIAGLVFTMILARLINPGLFGTYFFALSIASIFITFADLGIGATMSRYIASSLGKGNERLARSYMRFLLKIKIYVVIGGAGALFFGAGLLSVWVFGKPELALPLKIAAAYVFFQSILDFEVFVLSSLENFKYKFFQATIYNVFRIVIVPGLIIYGFGVCWALMGTVAAVALTVLFLTSALYHKYSFLFAGNTVPISRRKILKFVSYTTVLVVSYAIYTLIDTIMVGALMPMEYVGYYRAAGAIVTTLVGVISINQVILPVMSKATNINALKRMYQETFRYLSILAFPMAFGLIAVAEPAIKIIFTPDYLPAVIPLIILSYLIIDYIAGFMLLPVFYAKELPQYPAITFTVSLIFNVVLNYFFITAYGMIGAAAATVITRIAATVMLSVFLKKKLGISLPLSSAAKPLASSIVMIAVLYIIPKPFDILSGLLYMLFGAIVYFIIMLAIKGITKSEINFVISNLKSYLPR
ncbi:MAG: flippase [Candidatus Micrarchaeota archaeon]|nr:flippase [Candidatus Micrarchaeota archaeon]